MKRIVIIGAGPRGLAVALQASLLNKYEIIIIDKEPLSTWSYPKMLPDVEMRSPITFDLTTFIPSLNPYSLASFLDKKIIANTQQQVEYNTTFCNRKEFRQYLNFIIDTLKSKGVIFSRENVNRISHNKILTSNNIITYDYLVVATGRKSQEALCPNYLNNLNRLSIEDSFNIDWFNKSIYVIGSGQQAAELTYYLGSNKANVTWVQKHLPKIEQYPVPTIKQWGQQSALGDFYSNYIINKDEYLKNVKLWGPSITPSIYKKLKTITYKTLFNPSSTAELDTEAYFILATGFNQKVELLNFDFDIKRDKYTEKLPAIQKDFQSISHPNIYFTGLLTLRYDGPRQGSIISAAITAQTILNSINNN